VIKQKCHVDIIKDFAAYQRGKEAAEQAEKRVI